ncbi:MAG: hypothetical protein AAF741_15270 [Bacteroidota bacterium]
MIGISWLIVLLVWACAGESAESKDATDTKPAGREVSEASISGPIAQSLIANYFPEEVLLATDRIKASFEAGIRLPSEADSSLVYLYKQHARRLRLHFFDKDPISGVFPFNGKASLSQQAELVDRLPYMSGLCGFQKESGETINYYCPNLDETYFDYLEELGKNSEIITEFARTYQETKVIIPAVRQQMLMNAIEDLDLSDYDHQLFYSLFQFWVAEEISASLAIQAVGE